MPVDINKWKETFLDVYLEVSLVKKLREGAEQPGCCKCSFTGVQVARCGLRTLSAPWWVLGTGQRGGPGETVPRGGQGGSAPAEATWYYSWLPITVHLSPLLLLLLKSSKR